VHPTARISQPARRWQILADLVTPVELDPERQSGENKEKNSA